MSALFATTVANAKPQERDYKLSDGRGLYLLVRYGWLADVTARWDNGFPNRERVNFSPLLPRIAPATGARQSANQTGFEQSDRGLHRHSKELTMPVAFPLPCRL